MARVPGTRRRQGQVLVGLPKIDDDAPAEVKDALAIRAVAWVEGRCPNCGAERNLVAHPALGIVSIHFLHDDGCPVTEVLLDPHDP